MTHTDARLLEQWFLAVAGGEKKAPAPRRRKVKEEGSGRTSTHGSKASQAIKLMGTSSLCPEKSVVVAAKLEAARVPLAVSSG